MYNVLLLEEDGRESKSFDVDESNNGGFWSNKVDRCDFSNGKSVGIVGMVFCSTVGVG